MYMKFIIVILENGVWLILTVILVSDKLIKRLGQWNNKSINSFVRGHFRISEEVPSYPTFPEVNEPHILGRSQNFPWKCEQTKKMFFLLLKKKKNLFERKISFHKL